MKMKRKHLGFSSCLVILSCSLPVHLYATERSAAIGPQAPVAEASWQEDSMHVMMQQLCGVSAKAKAPAASRDKICVSLLTELVSESGEFQYYTPLALEDGSWSSSAGPRKVSFDTGSPEVIDKASADQIGLNDVGAVAAGQRAESGDDLVNQGIDGAIPGSLLVTILALIGIVAVARRDVAGKQNSNPVVRSGRKSRVFRRREIM